MSQTKKVLGNDNQCLRIYFIYFFCHFEIERILASYNTFSVFNFINLLFFPVYTFNFKAMLYKLPFMVYHLFGHL